MKSINLFEGIPPRKRALDRQVLESVETKVKNLITYTILDQDSSCFNPLWFKVKQLRKKDRNREVH